jgi:hypothetical protein
VAIETWGSWMPEGTISWIQSPWRDARNCYAAAFLNGERAPSYCDPRSVDGEAFIPEPGEGRLPRPPEDDTAITPAATPGLAMGAQPYRNFRGRLPQGWQANHLNQAAAYESVIPRDQGAASPMRGDAIRHPGTQHYRFHASLEAFWDQFRQGGARAGQRPTNAEYARALEQALLQSGHTAAETNVLVGDAARERASVGLRESDPVPRIPGRINQVQPAQPRINLLRGSVEAPPPGRAMGPPPRPIRLVPGPTFVRPPFAPPPPRPPPTIGPRAR